MTFHETILKKLIDYRESHPNFNFLTRQRGGAGKRFESGHWFQGNDSYAFVGLINASGGSNRTRSVGILIYPTEKGYRCYLEIVFNEENDHGLIEAYQSVINKIGDFKKLTETKFSHSIGEITKDDFSNLYNFLDKHYVTLTTEFKARNKEKVLVTKEKTEQLIDKLTEYRTNESSLKIKGADFSNFKSLLDKLKEDMVSHPSVLKNFQFKTYSSKSTYVKLSDHKNVIGGQDAHYEIRNLKSGLSVELHFEGSDLSKKRFQTIELPKSLEWFT